MKYVGRVVDALLIGASIGATIVVVKLGAEKVGDLGDYLGFIGAAVGAILTVGAAARIQQTSERRRQRQQEAEAVAQVRRAVEEALAIHTRAKDVFAIDQWKSPDAARLSGEAAVVRTALKRLLDQPGLTDGAIYAGSGAMQILKGVSRAADVFQESNGLNFGPRALAVLSHVDNVVNVTNSRLADVILYQART